MRITLFVSSGPFCILFGVEYRSCHHCVSVCLSVRLSTDLPDFWSKNTDHVATVCVSVCLCVCVPVCLSVRLSTNLPYFWSKNTDHVATVCVSVCLCVCVSVCLSVRLSTDLPDFWSKNTDHVATVRLSTQNHRCIGFPKYPQSAEGRTNDQYYFIIAAS